MVSWRTQPIVLIVATETIEQGAEIRIDFGVLRRWE